MATRGDGLKLMNRLDQLELHKAMAMELKWMLSKVIVLNPHLDLHLNLVPNDEER